MQLVYAFFLPFFIRSLLAAQEFFGQSTTVQFNSTNFYLNATCRLNVPIGSITAIGSALDLSYQLFGSQDFTVHKHRGDVIMVKKPKDPYPLFYISAVDRAGSSATAVVEVTHTCPTVSFDAVSYHFFALRRAPSSVVGHLRASGGDDIRYSTESEVFQVDEMTGTMSAKVILPIDTTSIFYIKASDRKGNTDVAEVVVEVIGCYMDVDVQHERRYNVVFEKRCYAFVLSRCESDVIVGAVRAKGYPEPTYEYRDQYFYLNPEDGVIMIKKAIEPGIIYELNVLAKNGQEPDNRDITLVTVDTRQCPPVTTLPTTPSAPPTSTPTTTTMIAEHLEENGNSIPVSPPLENIPIHQPGHFDIFEGNGSLAEDDPTAYNSSAEDPFPMNNETDVDIFNWGDASVSGVSLPAGSATSTTVMQKPGKNSSFVVHVMSVNISKTVKPLYVQKFHSGKIFVKSSRPNARLSADHQGMEIV